MNARITERTDIAATLEITVDAAAVDHAFEQVLRELAKSVKVPGFRPGRVPRAVLIRRVGVEALATEVREQIVDTHYPQAVREFDLRPVNAHTHADAPQQGNEFTFIVHTELVPEFTLADVDAITIEVDGAPIADADVEATVRRLREDHVTLVPVERAAEAGDVVMIESQGEGGQRMPVDLDRTEPHLVEQLLGRSIGDALTLDLGEDRSAPPPEGEADSEPLRRSLEIVIADIQAKERPVVDDDFAATLGFASWAEVDAEIRRGLSAERERETLRAQRDEFVQKLLDATELSLPPSLVRRKQEYLLEDLQRDLARRNLTVDGYLKALEEQNEREQFEQEWRQAAERSVKRDLVLERLIEVRGVALEEREFEFAVRQLAARERSDVGKFKREQGEEWLSNYRYLLTRDKTVEAIVREKVGARGRDVERGDGAEAVGAVANDEAASDVDTEPQRQDG
jgi:trigger factor